MIQQKKNEFTYKSVMFQEVDETTHDQCNDLFRKTTQTRVLFYLFFLWVFFCVRERDEGRGL